MCMIRHQPMRPCKKALHEFACMRMHWSTQWWICGDRALGSLLPPCGSLCIKLRSSSWVSILHPPTILIFKLYFLTRIKKLVYVSIEAVGRVLEILSPGWGWDWLNKLTFHCVLLFFFFQCKLTEFVGENFKKSKLMFFFISVWLDKRILLCFNLSPHPLCIQKAYRIMQLLSATDPNNSEGKCGGVDAK